MCGWVTCCGRNASLVHSDQSRLWPHHLPGQPWIQVTKFQLDHDYDFIKVRLVSRVSQSKLSPLEGHCPSLAWTTSATPQAIFGSARVWSACRRAQVLILHFSTDVNLAGRVFQELKTHMPPEIDA